ncbi:MAG: ribose-phosphate diphosphokinase [Candidatus Hadarchaeales archaeon]
MSVIIQGSASPKLSSRLADCLGYKLVRPDVRKFPDGEIYLRIGERLGKEVVVVQSLSPPQNEHLAELLFLMDLCRDMGAEKMVVVVPYLAYARQDRRFKEGEAITIQTISRLLERADKIVTVDAHSPQALSYFGRIEEVRCTPLLGGWLSEKMRLRDPLFLAPDEGSLERVREAAEKAGAEYDYLKKKRLSGRRVRTEKKRLAVRGRDVVILDDIISTGGTVVEACRMLKGARRVLACCVHGLLVGDAVQRMRRAGVERIVCTDTVESKFSLISVAGEVARHL